MSDDQQTDHTALDEFLGQQVVLDTQGPLVFIGRLAAYGRHGYWLTDVDVHNRADGHASLERYISDAHLMERSGSRQPNRRRVFVDRHAVVSVSALDDIMAEGESDILGSWQP